METNSFEEGEMVPELPRILSPNLGCPLILSIEELRSKGFDVVTAEEMDSAPGQISLIARPSYPGEGKEFSLQLQNREELTEKTLPPAFQRVEDTRFLISTTLSSSIFAGQARFFRYGAKPISSIHPGMLRQVGHLWLPTLYDLFLIREGKSVGKVFHALCLQPGNDRLRFIHLTDLHIALRNDLYAANLEDNVTYESPRSPGTPPFNNFNQNLRIFIDYANRLADEGELDFVLVLGDLIDFLHHGFHEREDYGDNNWRVFRALILGSGMEGDGPTPKPGLKVPIFTSTGNHDWRFFPYDVSFVPSVFGVNKKIAEQFDLLWADEQEEITQKVETTYARLLSEGAPVSRKTRWGQVINGGLRRLEKWQVKLLTPLGGSALIGLLARIPSVGGFLEKLLGSYYPIVASAIALVVIPILMESITGLMKGFLRRRIFDLLSIEAGWQALKEYFLTINPYFNYAFRLGRNYFLMLDTGHDCVRAQYLWDDGDKKLGPLSIRDNTIGQSPDSMAFYDINEYYPYSQISWIDRLLKLITQEAGEEGEKVRIFIGLHAPPANLSKKEWREAERKARDQPQGLLLEEGKYNIRYGTDNHYLSHFYHLCLGRVEAHPEVQRYRPVDIVFSGHAHWKIEFRLAWDQGKQGPVVYFGDFTGNTQRFRQTFSGFKPLLLQTPAAGPREEFSPDPPYFRRVEVDDRGNITRAEVLALKPDGTPYLPQFPQP